MNDESFVLSGPISRRAIQRDPPVIGGRRYRVWLSIAEISQGSICVWVGGNRTDFFTTPGEHIQPVIAGERMEVAVQGLHAKATIAGVRVSEAAD